MSALWTALAAVALLALTAGVASRRFRHGVENEARRLHAASRDRARLHRARLAELPGPVRRYLERAIGRREHAVRTLDLAHAGTFRPALKGRMLPIRGEQHFITDPPGFVWWGRLRLAPGVWIDARDRSIHGEGQMLVRLESLLTVADARGPKLDQGALLRLLAELVWIPTALLDERYVSWTPIDDHRARATLRVHGREVSATFEFGADQLPARISAERYLSVGKESVLTPWSGECADFREVSGLLVPHQMRSVWHIDGERFVVAEFVVQSVDYDAEPPTRERNADETFVRLGSVDDRRLFNRQ